MAFTIFMVAAVSTVWAIIIEGQIEDILNEYNINLATIIVFFVNRPFFIPVLVLTGYFGWAFYKVVTAHNWDDVEFVTWNPMITREAKGGIKIENNKNEVLENCEADMMLHESIGKEQADSIELEEMFIDSEYPAGLYWWVDNKIFEGPIDIGRGKEAYLVIVYYDRDPGVEVLGEKNPEYMKYLIKTKKTAHIGLFTTQRLIKIRISANVENKPLLPKEINVKVDVYSDDDMIIEILE